MVLKHRLIEMYDLLDFHCTELVMALPLGLVTCAPPSFWTRWRNSRRWRSLSSRQACFGTPSCQGFQRISAPTMWALLVISLILSLMSSTSPSTQISKISTEYQEILAEFQDIVGLGFTPGPVKHDVRHHVETRGPPISTPVIRLDPQKYAAAKADFEKMEKAGIFRWSNLPWSSAFHMVQKPDSSWCPCGDFCQLNNATVPDKYPVPNIQDFTGCQSSREWSDHQPTEVGLRPRGGEVFGTSGFCLGDPATPLQAVVKFPLPLTCLELQCFLGLVNFYQHFLRGAAGFLLPLTNALQGPGKSLSWSPLMEQAFNAGMHISVGDPAAGQEFWQGNASGRRWSFWELGIRLWESNRARAPSSRLPHQPDGRSIKHSCWLHSPSFQRSCCLQRLITAPSTGSCSPSTPPSTTSTSCWRIGSSSSSPITSLSATPWACFLLPGLPGSSSI